MQIPSASDELLSLANFLVAALIAHDRRQLPVFGAIFHREITSPQETCGVTADCGGATAISEAMLSLCRRVAAIEVQLEQMEASMSEGDLKVDLDLYNRLAGNLRRMLESIGLQRVARPVNDGSQALAEYFSRSPPKEA